MTKIDVISGFLGAGKTTLIKKLLKEAYQDEKIVLIENEFGEIGIDGGFLKDAGIAVTEMNSGCICCSLVGDFEEALKKVINEFQPDRIIIEPSGVGKLSDVVKAIQNVQEEQLHMNALTTIIDGKKFDMYMKNFKEFYQDQITHANTIIISRTQTMSQDNLQTVLNKIKGVNETASIVTTPWDNVEGVKIKEAMELSDLPARLHMHEECSCGHHHEHHHEHHHADEIFQTWAIETAKQYDQQKLQKMLESLSNDERYGTVLRAKGIVENQDGDWLEFDYVPDEFELRLGQPDTIGKLCVIGSNLNNENLKELFEVK